MSEEYESKEKVEIGPANPIWKKLFNILFYLWFLLLLTLIFSSKIYKIIGTSNFIGKIIFNFNKIVPAKIFNYLLIIFVITSIILFIIYKYKVKSPIFDDWVKDIAYKRLSCSYIYYDKNNLYFEYDVGLKTKDIKDFIQEISNKSKKYTYYLNEIDIDNYVVSIKVTKKESIPKRCTIDKNDDNTWNLIPMGKAVNTETQTVSGIGWYLNDNNVREDFVGTLPSTSLVIAGGTGSGKSVVENGIIGHITRHSNKIQGLLADVKQVEFGGLAIFKGIHKVALTVSEVADELEQARTIMMERFTFMKDNGVNNVYKLEDKVEVDWFEVNGHKFQFDEIFECIINGELKLLTLGKIYEAIEEGAEVEIDDVYLNDVE